MIASHDDVNAGLSSHEARERATRYGPNEVSIERRRPLLGIVLAQISSPLVIVLWVAAALSVVLTDWADAIAILAIILLNASLGSWQEARAEKAMASLRDLAAPTARVIRDCIPLTLPARELVPGDLVLLEAGDRIPADLKVREAHALEVDESILTGESLPVVKALGDLLFAGSTVVIGRGEGFVEAIGGSTEFGKIAKAVTGTSQPQTPLQTRLAAFGRTLSLLAVALVCVVVVEGLLLGEQFANVLLTGLSMAVAVVPEGLPAMLTIALAVGAQRMLRRNALIRRLDAIETLGSVTTICTDKTGTLTENRLKVKTLWPEEKQTLLLTGLALCNDARRESATQIHGDPTEAALLVAAEDAGLLQQELLTQMPRILEVPFSSETKLMTTVHSSQDPSNSHRYVTFTKGSLDAVLDLCEVSQGRAAVENEHDRLAAEGMRLLALAYRCDDAEPDIREIRDLSLVGLVGMADSLRPEAAGAVQTARNAGIRVVMITGDHPLTARQIAHQLDIPVQASVVASDLDESFLREMALTENVFARVSPHQKLQIVSTLQDAGEVVAVTGDGVNDAPALKKADVGIAMGRGGTDVAREAADVVLLDDNFATIVAAVEEGRAIYANLRKFIRYVMAGNFGEITVMLIAPLLGLPLPLTPLQILWVNLVTDGVPGLALTLEPAERGLMSRQPTTPREPLLARGLLADVLWIGIAVAIVPLTLGYIYWSRSDPIWRTIVFTSLTASQLWSVLALRSSRQLIGRTSIRSNPAVLLTVVVTAMLQCALLYVPWLRGIFDTLPLPPRDLAIVVSAGASTFVFVELRKLWLDRKFRLLRQNVSNGAMVATDPS